MDKWVLTDRDGNEIPAATGVPLEFDPVPIMEGGEWTEHGLDVLAERADLAAARAVDAADRAAATLACVQVRSEAARRRRQWRWWQFCRHPETETITWPESGPGWTGARSESYCLRCGKERWKP